MSSRQKEIKKFYKKIKKRYPDDPVVLSRDRKILEHLVFAIFLENASFEQARTAFAAMENYFIDWNEIRISKAREIADVVSELPDPVDAGERLRRLLQWIFDETFKFDLEDMRTKGRDVVYEFLSGVPYSTAFMNDYVSLFGFDGGNFPLDEGGLRALRLLDFVAVSEERREIVPELDAALNEAERLEFFFALHELGAELTNETKRAAAMKFLRSFDPAVDERSAEPLVEPDGPTDPREIARLVAKQEKRQKRSTPSMIDAMDMLDDSIDSDELDSGDDLLSKSDETEDFNGGFGDAFDSELDDDLRDVDDERGRGGKKQRVRRGAAFDAAEKTANEETTLTKDGATYSRFSDEGASLEEARKKSGAKPRKKSRNDDEKSASLFDLVADVDERIVREDAPTASKETFAPDEKVETEAKKKTKKTNAVELSSDSETAEASRKLKKRTRVKEKGDETPDCNQNVVAEKADAELKKSAPARKSTVKKEKTSKNAQSSEDAESAQESVAKPKTKARSAKSERNIDDESVMKIKEIEQKKPR